MADARSGTDKDLQAAGLTFLPSGGLKQGFLRGSLIGYPGIGRHQD
jgi:hypothetical protein